MSEISSIVDNVEEKKDVLFNVTTEVAQISSLLDEYESTSDKAKLLQAKEKIKHVSTEIEQLWKVPECKSKEVSQRLILISSKLREVMTRIRNYANPTSTLPPATTTTTTTTITTPSPELEPKDNNNNNKSEVRQIDSTSIVKTAIGGEIQKPQPKRASSLPVLSMDDLEIGKRRTRRMTQQRAISPPPKAFSPPAYSPPPPERLRGYIQMYNNETHRWHSRWVEQYGDKLYYFANEESERAIAHIKISEVSTICTSFEIGGFNLITSTKTYQLRTAVEGELNYWLHGLNQWKRYQESHSLSDDLEVSEGEIDDETDGFDLPSSPSSSSSSSLTSSSSSLSLSLSTSTSPPSTNNNNDDDNNNKGERVKYLEDQLTERILMMATLERQVKELSSKVEITEEENRRLKEEVSEKSQMVSDLTDRCRILDQEVEIRKNAKSSAYLEHIVNQLKAMQKDLKEKEKQINGLTADRAPLLEKLRRSEPTIRNLTENLSQSQMELQAKQRLISQMALELKELRHRRHQDIKSPNFQRELTHLRETIEAHQVQNNFLSSEIIRIQRENEQTQMSMTKTIQRLTEELETLTTEFQALRHQSFSLMGADNNYIQEFEDVKKELFYALGVGIKLLMAGRGESCNIDIRTLYDEAQHINYKKWHAWITQRMQSS